MQDRSNSREDMFTSIHFQNDFFCHGRKGTVVGVVLSRLVEGSSRDSPHHSGPETEYEAKVGVAPRCLLPVNFCHPSHFLKIHSLQNRFQK